MRVNNNLTYQKKLTYNFFREYPYIIQQTGNENAKTHQAHVVVLLNILEAKGLFPLREPMVSFLPKLFLSWSLPINFVTWYVFTVVHPDITIADWQRVYKECLIKPKI